MLHDVVTRTERLIEVDTAPGRSVDPLAGLIAEQLTRLGAQLCVQEAEHAGVPQRNLIARLGGDGPAGLVLAGHLDTVPWSSACRATNRPERDGRTLYGRGSCDMKGPIAAQLEALAMRAERLVRPVVLAYTYAEEVGCHGARRLAADPSVFGVVDGPCIVGEPTGLVPITEHKGYAVARITLAGEPAHSSDPWAGCDASVALGVLLRELHTLRDRWLAVGAPGTRHQPPCTTINTGVVNAGSATNVVPDRAEVAVEWRPLPGADADGIRAAVQAALDAACAAAPGVTGTLDWPDPLPAFAQADGAHAVDWICARTGHAPGVVAFYTEGELYRRALDVPTIVCGPGSIANAHRVDESIRFDELEAGVALYADAIDAFCT